MGAAGQSDAAYTIDQSCRFNDDDSAYLYRTFSGGDQTEWTFSTWVKRGNLGSRQAFFGLNGVTLGLGKHSLDKSMLEQVIKDISNSHPPIKSLSIMKAAEQP